MSDQYKYFAFISYSSKDLAWGKRLHRKLEGYKLPSTMCSDRSNRRPLKPIFFAPADIQPGGLDNELEQRLAASANLIVICSPHSAQSKWVGKEIEYFNSLGRRSHIHFFIVDGKPNSGDAATECFNPIIKELGFPEILGVNINEHISPWPLVNRERAYIQLITKLLNVEFDSLWNRQRRRLRERILSYISAFVLAIAVLLGVMSYLKPIDVNVSLSNDADNANLPALTNAIITVQLSNETKRDTIATISDHALLANVPRSDIGNSARITVKCTNFLDIDTVITLDNNITLPIVRDPAPYGNVHFILWNETTEAVIANKKVTIDGQTLHSDSDGVVHVFIPLNRQNTEYTVSIDNSTHTIIMPCGENDCIVVH